MNFADFNLFLQNQLYSLFSLIFFLLYLVIAGCASFLLTVCLESDRTIFTTTQIEIDLTFYSFALFVCIL